MPSGHPASVNDFSTPPSITYLEPVKEFLVLDSISSWETEAMLANASPLKPSVDMDKRSCNCFILLVACGINASLISSLSIPLPLSVTRIKLLPPSLISTVTEDAPASIAFSSNSLTTATGLSITSPAAILFTVSLSRTCIDILSP